MSISSIQGKKLKKIILLCSGVLLLVIMLLAQLWLGTSDDLRVTFFDIGQGDSILVQTPSGHTILIDGGPDRSVLAKLGRALPFYDRSIDLLVLTHPHADHVIGLVEVLQRYDVANILFTDAVYSADEYLKWLLLVDEKETNQVLAQRGQTFSFGEATLEVVYPFQSLSGEEFDDINDSSIVTKLIYQDISFLFTGDAPISVEEKLLAYNSSILDVDVLKVGHHGSRYSSSIDFLQAVSPTYSIIQSEEDNSFKHPHEIVLRRIMAVGSEILRNDQMGDIELRSDGNRVWTITP